VGISSNNGVVVEKTILGEYNSGKVLQVDLMHNTGARRDNLEVVESTGAPLEELESLSVPVELDDFVLLGSVGGSVDISLDGVINDEIDRAEGVNFGGISSESLHGVTHGSEINNGWHTTIK
jgi:hypothetical protein